MKRASHMTPVQSADAGMISPIRAQSVSFTVLGVPASKSNRRRAAVNPRTGQRMSIKSKEALKYCEDFALQVPPEAKQGLGSQTALLRGIISVWYPALRSDVDVELIWDLLQKCGVVTNDRWIREKFIYGAEIDPANPRVEITVEEI